MLGGFYTDEETELFQRVPAINPTMFVTHPDTGAQIDYLLAQDQTIGFKEYAAFANVTFEITDRFDVQLGGRKSHNEVSYSDKPASGPLYPIVGQPFAFVAPAFKADDEPFTYLAVARYRPSSELMVYARVASGYRVGGPNPNPELLGSSGLPVQFDADTTRNYEVGAKGSLWNRALTYEAALYYIDWTDIQISTIGPLNATYFVNGRKARSQGVELSAEARPIDGMSISGWIAWSDAEITEDFSFSTPFATVNMRKGDELPFSSPFSGTISLMQEFPLGSAVTGVVGGAVSYVDGRKSSPGGPRPLDLPSYTEWDLHGGVKYGSWELNVFINNVTDGRGALAGDPTPTSQYIYIVRPRMIGVSLAKSF